VSHQNETSATPAAVKYARQSSIGLAPREVL